MIRARSSLERTPVFVSIWFLKAVEDLSNGARVVGRPLEYRVVFDLRPDPRKAGDANSERFFGSASLGRITAEISSYPLDTTSKKQIQADCEATLPHREITKLR